MQNSRLKAFKNRVGKFTKMQAVGVKLDKLMRTGGLKAITYGDGVMGVADSMLRNQRRAAAAATAPVGGTGGQHVDLALMMADGSARGKADPAYDAH